MAAWAFFLTGIVVGIIVGFVAALMIGALCKMDEMEKREKKMRRRDG